MAQHRLFFLRTQVQFLVPRGSYRRSVTPSPGSLTPSSSLALSGTSYAHDDTQAHMQANHPYT